MKAHDELLYWAMVNNHPLYERYLLEEYEAEHGQHFDEHRAKAAVAEMYSEMGKGEHWSIEQIKSAIEPYRSKMGDEDTCWDAYVALNLWWHDLGENYLKRSQSDAHLIEDAMTFFFNDEDADEGKIWRYIKCI